MNEVDPVEEKRNRRWRGASRAGFVTDQVRVLLTLVLLFGASCATSDVVEPVVVAKTATRARSADRRYISWREHLIDDQGVNGGVPIRGADGLELADLDRDGHIDIVSVHEDSHHIRLAFGSADPDEWELVTLAEGPQARAAEDVAIADTDGDGWLDIIVACELAHLIYFRNPAVDIRTGAWKRVIPDVTRDRGSFIRVFFADLDGDGRFEVTAANKGEQLPGISGYEERRYPAKEISWFKLPKDPLDETGWTEHVLARIELPMNAEPVDLDGDGDLDILGGSRHEARVFWFENLGGTEVAFREHPINVTDRNSPWQRGAKRLTGMNVAFHDLNGDGRLDIVLQETPTLVVWLEQPEDDRHDWLIHRIGHIAPDSSTGLAIADIDGDNLPDVITGGYSGNPRDHDGADVTVNSPVGRLAWFKNPGDASARWTRHDISRRKRGMYDMFIARDMDGDGDVDFVTTRGNSGEFDGVLWLEQVRTEKPVWAFWPARASESAHLPLP